MTTAFQQLIDQARQQPAPAPDANARLSSPDECAICGGMGLVTLDVPIGDPRFGKAYPCECQKAAIAAGRIGRLQKRLGSVGVPPRYRPFTFGSFAALPDHLRQNKNNAFLLCRSLVEGPVEVAGEVKPGVVLSGPFGVGKSGLAAAMISEWSKQDLVVMWLDFLALIARVQDAYGAAPDEIKPHEMIKSVAGVPYLVIDDLGDVDRLSEETPDKRRILYEIINHRHGELLPTIITTNLSPEQFEYQFGRRIAEKVGELTHWLSVGGDSLRFK